MLLAFLTTGLWELVLAASKFLSSDHERVFVVQASLALTLLYNLPMAIRFRRLSSGRVGFCALGAGICALLGTSIRQFAIRDVDASIVFPAVTMGVIVSVMLCERIFWKISLTRMHMLGLTVGLLGIAFLFL